MAEIWKTIGCISGDHLLEMRFAHAVAESVRTLGVPTVPLVKYERNISFSSAFFRISADVMVNSVASVIDLGADLVVLPLAIDECLRNEMQRCASVPVFDAITVVMERVMAMSRRVARVGLVSPDEPYARFFYEEAFVARSIVVVPLDESMACSLSLAIGQARRESVEGRRRLLRQVMQRIFMSFKHADVDVVVVTSPALPPFVISGEIVPFEIINPIDELARRAVRTARIREARVIPINIQNVKSPSE